MVYATSYFLSTNLALPRIPPSLSVQLAGLFTDSAAPMQIFGSGLMAAGAVLIIVSIVYRRWRAEEED
ncbi:MAG: hypothetical protein QGG49_03395 [Dehalococcoidales bacterium]|mgnify:CR=1|nr:hypothetical protein [Dehalococcoidales bacterium]MDP6576942.1 hypothetical protein [Dehalococcoidales bacterium]